MCNEWSCERQEETKAHKSGELCEASESSSDGGTK